MITDQPMSWLLALVAIWTVAIALILLTLVVIGPTIWREGRTLIRGWLTPDRPSVVVDFDEARRRKQLNAASGMRP